LAINSNEQKSVAEENVIAPEKATTEKTPISSVDTLSKSVMDTNTYYSVQIGANTIAIEPSAANFKGLKEVRREKSDKYYRYYIGKETSLENIAPILQKIKLKYSQAFIVYFIDGKRTIINTNSN